MKRFLTLLLSIAVLLTLVSCTAENQSTSSLPDDESSLDSSIVSADNSSELSEPEVSDTDDAPYTPALWRITDENGAILWLFGSIHVGTESYIPFPEPVMTAFNSSDSLAVELDIIAFEKDLAAQMKALMGCVYNDGTKISAHIDEALYNDCVAVLKENDSYSATLNVYYPVIWMSFIENFSYIKAGYSSDYGVDRLLLQLAYDDGKTILEVESAELQYSVLASFSDPLQEILLRNSLEAYTSGTVQDDLNALVDAWYSGDIDALADESFEDVSGEELEALYDEYYKAMLVDRNLGMADYCEECLKNGGTTFFCVGAAHYLGDDGLIALLASRGYFVERIEY